MFHKSSSLPCPKFEDGKTVRRGDLVFTNRGTAKVVSFSVRDDGESWLDLGVLDSGERICKRLDPGERVKRAENDSWERVESDIDSGKGYTGMDAAEVAADVLRRCKALAGVE